MSQTVRGRPRQPALALILASTLGLATLAFFTKSIPMLYGIGALGIACSVAYVLAGVDAG